MGRIFIPRGWAALLVGVSFALQPVEAKDRNSSGSRDRKSGGETTVARAAMMRQNGTGGSTGKAASPSLTERLTSKPNGDPIAPLADQLPARSNPLQIKLGAVTLQPAVGGIKGAQLSIGF